MQPHTNVNSQADFRAPPECMKQNFQWTVYDHAVLLYALSLAKGEMTMEKCKRVHSHYLLEEHIFELYRRIMAAILPKPKPKHSKILNH